MAAGLRHVVLGLLHRHVSGPRHAHPAPGRVRISQQGCRYALADVLGLCPIRRRAGAERGVRRGVRQFVAGRSVPHRFRPARPLRGKRTVRTAQSIRPAVRPCLRRNACHSRRDLSNAEDGRDGSAACTGVHQDWRCAHGGSIRPSWLMGVGPNRRLCHHQHGDRRRAVESSHEDGRSPAGPVARQLRNAPLDDRSALPRHHWSTSCAAPDQRPEARTGLHGQCARHFWHHRDRRREYVPLLDAVERCTGRELDRMGCLIESTHPVRDAAGDADLSACRPRLHRDCFRCAARAGDCEAY